MNQRGQALVETAVVAPLIVLAIAGILFSAKTAVVRERLQVSARYSGLLLSYGDTYADFSMYALDHPNASSSCPTPPASSVNGTDHTGTGSSAFYQLTASTFSSSCNLGASGQHIPNFMTIQDAKYTYGAVLLSRNSLSETAKLGRNPFLNVTSSYKVQQTYLRTPTLGTQMKCYPDIAAVVALTSAAANDNVTPTTPATPLPDVLPVTPLRLDPSCLASVTQGG